MECSSITLIFNISAVKMLVLVKSTKLAADVWFIHSSIPKGNPVGEEIRLGFFNLELLCVTLSLFPLQICI